MMYVYIKGIISTINKPKTVSKGNLAIIKE